MAIASDQQVQAYVDSRVRPRCEIIRKLYLLVKDDSATIDDVYAALTQPTPTWTDNRPDFPPHLLTPSDVLAWNTFIVGFTKLVEGTFANVGEANGAAAQYPVILDACVRSPEIV